MGLFTKKSGGTKVGNFLRGAVQTGKNIIKKTKGIINTNGLAGGMGASAFNSIVKPKKTSGGYQGKIIPGSLEQGRTNLAYKIGMEQNLSNAQNKLSKDRAVKNSLATSNLNVLRSLNSEPNKIATAMSKFTSKNVPDGIDAPSLYGDINYWDTPSYLAPSGAESGLTGYLGASALNSGSNMGMSGSTVGTPTTTGATTTMTPLEEEQKRREEDVARNQEYLIEMMNELAGKPKDEARLEKQTGLPQISSELRDLQAKQTMQTAQYMSQIQDIQNKPIAMEFIAGQQGETNRRAGIDAMITSALIQGKQGQLQTAQDTIDRALKLKYDPIIQRIDLQKQILDMNYQNLNRADRQLADSRNALLDLQKDQTNYDRDLRKTLVGDISTGIANGSIDSNSGYSQIQKILDENTKLSDIYKSMGITDANNPGIVNGYDITSYATDPNHELKINAIVQSNNITNSNTAQEAINKYTKKSPITGQMIISSANKYSVDPNVMFALMLNDSTLGTAGKAVRTLNPGNVGNIDSGAERKYKSWDAGVDGVAEWLSKHKAKALYNGEFADTINNIVTFEPQKSQKTVQKNLQSQIANGNYASAYTQMQNSVSKGLTGDNKTRYDSARIDVNVLGNLQKTLTQYENAGGDTNLLKGSVEKITRKLGALKTDPKFAQLAVQMEREFQNYRNQMTGAAFTPEESREYEAVNPSGKKSFALNSSVITGAVNQLRNRVYSTEESLAGDGIKYIREYAFGIDPLLLQMNNAVTGGGPTVTNSNYFNNLY